MENRVGAVQWMQKTELQRSRKQSWSVAEMVLGKVPALGQIAARACKQGPHVIFPRTNVFTSTQKYSRTFCVSLKHFSRWNRYTSAQLYLRYAVIISVQCVK